MARNVLRPTTDLKSGTLDRALNVELAHAGLQSGALHAKERGGATGTGDTPFGLTKGAENVFAVGFLERGNRGG